VGFAMDALGRLANLRPQSEAVSPIITDLQTNISGILADSPIQCWEALVRGGVGVDRLGDHRSST
jgi:hypothetical protein